jgi:hypothetical protein
MRKTKLLGGLLALALAVIAFLPGSARADACTGSTVEGLILDAVTSAPLSGVQVASFNRDTGVKWDETTTNSAGYYILSLNECAAVRLTTKGNRIQMANGFFTADAAAAWHNYFDTEVGYFGYFRLDWRYILN